ncbi:MAG: alpha-acetolactate decarboxylase [Gammaproteobacteria bacterium RIFCSPHIGHO2_12_FULL_37_14]|nr:MAG: alpha-acetolactate decarboxylase [Gammaproteobacteria bacterium RIFCSPHIGHO2_12_FULL_37_14]
MLGCSLFISLAFAGQEKSIIFQVATIGSLAQGVYDGDYKYGRLMKKGDLGVGTFKDLNGELVAVDGKFYQIEASGKLNLVSANQIVPFAEVTFFKPTMYSSVVDIVSYQNLGKVLLDKFPNKNIPYAIRIDGTFSKLKLRSLRKQKKPYPLLTQAAKEQAIFNLNHVTGTVVGFWFPTYWAGIAVPEFHLHFVTTDRTTGGHVLDIDVSKGQVSLQPIHQVQVYLPNTQSFAQANLSSEELNVSIKKAEGGSSQ